MIKVDYYLITMMGLFNYYLNNGFKPTLMENSHNSHDWPVGNQVTCRALVACTAASPRRRSPRWAQAASAERPRQPRIWRLSKPGRSAWTFAWNGKKYGKVDGKMYENGWENMGRWMGKIWQSGWENVWKRMGKYGKVDGKNMAKWMGKYMTMDWKWMGKPTIFIIDEPVESLERWEKLMGRSTIYRFRWGKNQEHWMEKRVANINHFIIDRENGWDNLSFTGNKNQENLPLNGENWGTSAIYRMSLMVACHVMRLQSVGFVWKLPSGNLT